MAETRSDSADTTRPDAAVARRRLLIVTSTFFPDPMVASVRMTQWCRHLPELGWQVDVIVRHYGYVADAELLKQHVNEHVRVHYITPAPPISAGDNYQKSTSSRQSLAARTRQFIASFLVPDPTIILWRQRQAAILDLARKLKPDCVLTSSPPHAVHHIGPVIARELGIPWVADYRDPHVIDRRFMPQGVARVVAPLHMRFARRVYERASLIIHAIPVQYRASRRRYPHAKDRMVVVENGVPVELAEGQSTVVPALTPPTADGQPVKSIRVVGAIEPAEKLLLAQAVRLLNDAGQPTELRLVGAMPKTFNLLRSILGDRLCATGYVRHDEALRQVAGADVLVSALGKVRSENLQLTSKLFEFLATGKPVVTVNPSVPDRHLLRGMPGVEMLKFPSPVQVADALRRALASPGRPAEAVRAFREKYNRRTQAHQVAGMLSGLITRAFALASVLVAQLACLPFGPQHVLSCL
jgi:glycosyltransferase involved in cell wall biosynthesis